MSVAMSASSTASSVSVGSVNFGSFRVAMEVCELLDDLHQAGFARISSASAMMLGSSSSYCDTPPVAPFGRFNQHLPFCLGLLAQLLELGRGGIRGIHGMVSA